MFTKRFKLFSLFGFPLYIDLSWFLLAILITWSLAVGWFPEQFEELSTTSYWVMGAAGAIGLFVSIVLHEFGHAIVARWHGMRIRGVTLFIFGGVAELGDEPPSATAELLVAIAGPVVSMLIAGACFAMYVTAQMAAWPNEVLGVAGYLAAINAILVAFNMLPAFPLDGGRVLRGLLWLWKDNLRWATRITSSVGRAFGIGFIALGVLAVISGNFIGGMWWFLIGLFLRRAAEASYEQLLIRRALEGEPVSRFATRDPVTVPPDISIQDLVDDYVYKHHFKLYPVTRNGNLIGCVTLDQIREIPKDQWSQHRVSDIADECSDERIIDPDCDSMKALAKLNRIGASRLMVVDHDNRLVGVLALKDLMRFLSTKIDLEDASETPAGLRSEE